MKSRTRLPKETWQALKSAYLVGTGMRALARRCGIPEGTLMAKAHREGWNEERRAAMELLKPQREHGQMELNLAQLTELYHQNAAGLCQRLTDHICALPAGAAFDEIGKVNLADQMIRRFLRLDKTEAAVHITLWSRGATVAPSIIEVDAVTDHEL